MPNDKYLSFNYKNPTFSTTAYSLHDDFKGFVINEGVDLTFFNPSSFSHEFMTPQFASQSYFMGTTQENREFTFPILLQGVTMAEYKTFLRWLNPRNEGILWFDYNENYGYDVKVNSISEGKFMVDANCVAGVQNPTYNVELTVGFITKNDWAARWIGAEVIYELYTPRADMLVTSDGTVDFTLEPSTNYLVVLDNDNITDYMPQISPSYTTLTLSFSNVKGNLILENDSNPNSFLYMEAFKVVIEYDVGWIVKVFEDGSPSPIFEESTVIGGVRVFIMMDSSDKEVTITNNNNITDYYTIDWDYTNYQAFAIIINGTYKTPLEAQGRIYSQYGIAINNGNFVTFDGEIEPFGCEPGESITIGFPDNLTPIRQTTPCITVTPTLREII